MKARTKIALTFLLLVPFVYHFAIAQTKKAPATPVTYSVQGHGPSILLLHDSSKGDLAWTKAARQLATRFEVTLVDVSDLISDSQAVNRLRSIISQLKLNDARIAGSETGELLAIRYALSYPQHTRSFTLPHNGEDLEILADLINSTPFTRS